MHRDCLPEASVATGAHPSSSEPARAQSREGVRAASVSGAPYVREDAGVMLRVTPAAMQNGPLVAAIVSYLPGLRDLLDCRPVGKLWCDASHWFVIGIAVASLEDSTEYSKEALLGLLRYVSRRQTSWLFPSENTGLWRALRWSWEVPVPWPSGRGLPGVPIWTLDYARHGTPLRTMGLDAVDERARRCFACKTLHFITRRLFRKGDTRERVRSLGCYLLQVLFMYVEVTLQSAHLAAGAAIALATLSCEVGATPTWQLREVLVEIENRVRGEVGEPRLEVENHADLNEKVCGLKMVVLRALRFDLSVELPHSHVDHLVPRLLSYIPGGASLIAKEFRLRIRERTGGGSDEEDLIIDSESTTCVLSDMARRFIDDMLLSMSPLLADPSVIAAGAVLVAMEALGSSSASTTILRSLKCADHWLNLRQLDETLEEWSELRKSQGKLVATFDSR